MTHWRSAALLALSLLVSTRSYADPARFAVVLGNNLGHDARRPLLFAEADARKVAKTLVEVGGFAAERVRLLLGAEAEQAWRTVRAVARAAAAAGAKGGGQSLLLVYYSGHADGDVLELGTSSLHFARLASFLRQPGITVRLAFIDSCKSGSLVTMKGGRRGPAYQIRVSEQMRSSGYAIITSSTEDELSQEAAEIRGSFFSHYLVSGLRGAADESGDGKVTLGEAYRYAYARTVARTIATIGGPQHPMYQFKLKGQGEIVLSEPAQSPSYLAVTSKQAGRLVVLDAKGESVVAERELSPARQVRLALAPGSYWAYLLSDQQLAQSRVELQRGGAVYLQQSAFRAFRPTRAVAKGGLFPAASPASSLSLDGGFLLRRAALKTGDLTLGAALGLRLETASGWTPLVQLLWSTAPDAHSGGYYELGLGAGAEYRWTLGPLTLGLGALAGYEHLFQRSATLQGDTSALGYVGRISLALPMGPLSLRLASAAGGRFFQLAGSGWVHRVDLQLHLGLGWRFAPL